MNKYDDEKYLEANHPDLNVTANVAFEKHFSPFMKFDKNGQGRYIYSMTIDSWIGWQAAWEFCKTPNPINTSDL